MGWCRGEMVQSKGAAWAFQGQGYGDASQPGDRRAGARGLGVVVSLSVRGVADGTR